VAGRGSCLALGALGVQVEASGRDWTVHYRIPTGSRGDGSRQSGPTIWKVGKNSMSEDLHVVRHSRAVTVVETYNHAESVMGQNEDASGVIR